MSSRGNTILRNLLILFLVFAGLYFAKKFLMPLAIGGVLATLFLPFHKWLMQKKMHSALAALMCLFVLLAVVAGIGTLLGWQVSELVSDFRVLQQKITETIAGTQQYINTHFGISVTQQSEILKTGQPSVSGIIQVMIGSVATLLTNVILFLAYMFLILHYRAHIKQFFLRLAWANQYDEAEQVIHSVGHVSQEYMVGLAKMIVCLWFMYGIGFSVIGVENAIFFAILCGVLEIVPYIGNITSTLITLMVAAVHGASPVMLFGIAAVYGVVQFIQGWVLEPLILGPQVRINPLFTIIALVIGQIVWGIPGVFLAIPIMAMCKIICDHIEPLKPYGFLIGETTLRSKTPGIIRKIKSWFKKRKVRFG